jgi:exosome complex component MTR3
MRGSADFQDTEPVNHAALLTNLLLPALRLHLLPKLSVDVHLLVLEADGDAAVLSAGLTAASAAIADAGIPMSALAVGSVVVSLAQGWRRETRYGG